jgi:tetratricopeptide (TPR) repeat protein
VYNLAAYHYASHDKNLEQALTYAEKAMTLRPDYAPYLDTKAYVLVKLGKKDDGLALLREAQKKSPNDRIIAARIIALESGLWKS